MLHITATSEDEAEKCPIRSVLAAVLGKWQSLILLSLEDGSLRFSAIRRAVGDITQRVLTENLRDLERDGYLTRTVVSGPPVEVHYAMTPLGRSLLDRLKPLVIWAAERSETVRENRRRYDEA
jgi:DNA-binding HxlR family transcriptional regulator